MRPRGSSRVDHILGQQVALRSKSKPGRLVLELGDPEGQSPTCERTHRSDRADVARRSPGLEAEEPVLGLGHQHRLDAEHPREDRRDPALTPLCDLHPWRSPLSKRPSEDKNARALYGC